MTYIQVVGRIIDSLPVLLALGLSGVLYYSRSLDKVHLILLGYLFICLGVDISSRIYASVYGNNLVFISISGFLELIAFAAFYYHFITMKWFFWPLILISLTAMILLDSKGINMGGAASFQSYARVITSFTITTMSIICFFDWISSEANIRKDLLLLNSAVLFFYAFNLVCFLPVNFMINAQAGIGFWFANFLVTLAFYTLLIVLIWKHGKSRKQLRRG